MLGCGLLTAATVAYLQPSLDRDQYLVIAPPGWSLAQTINLATRADGRLVRTGRFANMLFVASENPHFMSMVRAAGAWLVIPSPGLWGCDSGARREVRS